MVEDLIIIGSGPAGFAASIYAGRAQLSPLLITGSALGGQMALANEIENYPGFLEAINGQELTQLMQRQAERFGTRVEMDEVTGVDFSVHPFKVKTYAQEHEAKAVIISTGASSRKLGVPGEEEFTGRGVSYCATCDGFFYQNRTVIVVGGGDSAVEEAMFLTKYASKVYLVHRRNRLRAEKVTQERAFRNEKIEWVWDSVVTEILGDQGVAQARIRNVKTDEEFFLKADGIFIYIGNVPNTQFLNGQVELNERGYIVTDRKCHTSVPGVFAAGDVQEWSLQQIATAVGSGAMAAMEADKFIAELEGTTYPERTYSHVYWGKSPDLTKSLKEDNKVMVITKDMPIGQIVQKYPKTVEVFLRHGLMCFGCAIAQYEDVEQGAIAHGIDIEALMKDLNAVVPEAAGSE